MIGAADTLDQAAGPFRCADIDDEVHIAPVDAQIQRRGRHHRLERAGRHRRLDLAAAGGIERAMMQRDGQAVLVRPPQFLKQQLGLAAGIHENQRQIVGLDGRVDFRNGVARAMAGPGQRRLRFQHADVVRRAAVDRDEIRKSASRRRPVAAPDTRTARSVWRRWPTARSAPDPAPGSQAAPGRAPAGRRAWSGASACSSSRMIVSRSPNSCAASGCDSSSVTCSGVVSSISGGRWRWRALRLDGRVAAARLDADRQRHLLHRQQQVAGDIGSQRLERRDIERMHARTATALDLRQGDQAGQEAGQRLARARRGDQQRRIAVRHLARAA